MRKRTYLISIDPEGNRYRYYQLIMQTDMFGAVIETAWGRLGEKPKGTRKIIFQDKKAASKYRKKVVGAKIKKNYMKVT